MRNPLEILCELSSRRGRVAPVYEAVQPSMHREVVEKRKRTGRICKCHTVLQRRYLQATVGQQQPRMPIEAAFLFEKGSAQRRRTRECCKTKIKGSDAYTDEIQHLHKHTSFGWAGTWAAIRKSLLKDVCLLHRPPQCLTGDCDVESDQTRHHEHGNVDAINSN